MSRGNLHTHTIYCDGKDTPEELVRYAIAEGCDHIGFSSHSYTGIPDDEPYSMSPEATEKYVAEVTRLKEIYRGKIKILLGIEQDYFSDCGTESYDYVIGSVHYVCKDGVYIPVDATPEIVTDAVERYYGGNIYAYIEDYYALAGDVYRKTKCDIVGHFDVVTKFNEGGRMFDTADPRYIAAADRALDRLLCEDVTFEINSGAVSRGYRTEPYPEPRILERIRMAGKPLIYTSDCHKKECLMFGIPNEGEKE